jgi:hypothetical protein
MLQTGYQTVIPAPVLAGNDVTWQPFRIVSGNFGHPALARSHCLPDQPAEGLRFTLNMVDQMFVCSGQIELRPRLINAAPVYPG